MPETTDTTRKREGRREDTLFSEMTKSYFDFWQAVTKETLRCTCGDGGLGDYRAGTLRPLTARSLHEMFSAVHDSMTTSGILDSLPHSMHKSMEMCMGLTENWAQTLGEMVEETLEGASRSLADNTECPQDGALRTFLAAYTRGMQKLFNMPKLGLNRYYQERISRASDQFTLFSVAAGEFLLLMMQPLESTLIKMQQRIREMADNDSHLRDARDYYSLWISILEGDYANLLKSPEYVRTFHDVLHKYLDYTALSEAVVEDSLRSLPITTKKEMEAVYRENHELKKQFKSISKRLAALEERLPPAAAGPSAPVKPYLVS
ncbi:MAG: hypothetical protein JW781_06010 [Deltaproteobacteria bacterium]|nr:hypothetical protein [Candidatus Anaeroferrophillacea bacterium]